jgi:hypothetical protein
VLNIYANLATAKTERLRRHERHAAVVSGKKSAAADRNIQVEQKTVHWKSVMKVMVFVDGRRCVHQDKMKERNVFVRSPGRLS